MVAGASSPRTSAPRDRAGGDSTEAMRLLVGTTASLERAVGLQHAALLAFRQNLRAARFEEPSCPEGRPCDTGGA